ncbi:MAG: class I tRNA ligase family protein, partial [Pseudomonadales bacterium]
MSGATTLQLFDTWQRKVRPFEPLAQGRAGVYCCGPTVYDFAHIGNLRTYLFEDLLVRVLRANGYQVQLVMNITDVGHLTSDADTGEDKMEVSARRTGKSAWELADYYTDAFRQDMARLNIVAPDVWCKATEHIDDQIAFISEMEAKGFTYTTDDGIYFDSTKLDDYGYLARLDIDGLRAGARVEQGTRRALTDFALWK